MKRASSLDEITLGFSFFSESYKSFGGFYACKARGGSQEYVLDSPLLHRENQNAHLLLGHRGSGKSMELGMLKENLQRKGHKVSVVQCRHEVGGGMMMTLSYYDLLILAGKHLYELAREANCPLPESLLDNIGRFWGDIEIFTLRACGEGMDIREKISVLFSGLAEEVRVGIDTKEAVRGQVKENIDQWVGCLAEISDSIAASCSFGKKPVIIFDDLDKLLPVKTWEIFENPLSKMPFIVICTFPIELSCDPRFAELKSSFVVHTLPAIKVRHHMSQGGGPFLDGIVEIKAIAGNCMDLSLFEEDALSLLIEKTGGVLGDFLECVGRAADRAQSRKAEKIEKEDAVFALNHLFSYRVKFVWKDNFPLLRSIHERKRRMQHVEEWEMLLEMMQVNVVIEYNDGIDYLDLHPLTEDYLRRHGELGPG